MIGIYMIISPSSRIYIGQSWNIKDRFSQYDKTLANSQPLLNRSFLKYGIDKHIFYIIHLFEKNITQIELDKYETLYWQFYKNCGFGMLNIREPGSRGKHSEKTKEKISISHLGKKWSDQTKNKFKSHPSHTNKVVMLDLEGNFVKEFRNANEVAIYLNTVSTWIGLVLKGKRKTCKGYRLMYKLEFDKLKKVDRIVPGDTREISQFDLKGNFLRDFLSIKEAEKYIGKIGGNPNIIKCCKGERNYAYGFKWKYKN